MLPRLMAFLVLMIIAGCGAPDPLAEERANYERVTDNFKKEIHRLEKSGVDFKAAYQQSHAKIENDERLTENEVDRLLYDPRFNRFTQILLKSSNRLSDSIESEGDAKFKGVQFAEASRSNQAAILKEEGLTIDDLANLMGDPRLNNYAIMFMANQFIVEKFDPSSAK
jgi:molecular chaperone GrpE (heat shock protein)